MRITDKEMSLNDITIIKSITVTTSVLCQDMPKKTEENIWVLIQGKVQ